MAAARRSKYTAEERERYGAFYERLCGIIISDVPDSAEFKRELDAALEAGFPVNFPNKGGNTLLFTAARWPEPIRAGLPQVLIDAGADVNVRNKSSHTSLSFACWNYARGGRPEHLAVIDTLLAAGARPELDESWQIYCDDGEQQARRDRLKAYIDTWPERRAQERAKGTAPAFDYAL